MNEELIEAAELGEEARKFIESDLGKAMIDLAAREVGIAQDKLLTVDASDQKAVRDLQNQAWLGNKFKEWLEEIIDRADGALAIFKQQQEIQ